MIKKKNKPEIRFKGYSGKWEEEKFSQTFSNIPNNTLSRAELNYNSGLGKNVHYGDILIRFGELLDVEKDTIPFITNDALAIKFMSSKLQNGDVIIADAAEDETVGKCTELVNVGEEILVSGLHTITVRPTLFFALKYLGYYMNSTTYHNQLLRLMQGTKVSSISKTAIKDTVICYPFDTNEQSQIGTYFQNLDKLITLHHAKYTKLENIKKAMLEKMFPKNGADVPVIRFKGFVGKWEEKNLGKEVNLENGFAFKSRYFQDEPSDMIVLTPGNVYIGGGFQEGKGRFYDVSGEFPDKFIMKPKDLFVTMTDLTPTAQTLGYPAIVPKDSNTYLLNQRLGKLTEFKGDTNFLFYSLSTEYYHKQIVQTASGTTVKHSSPQKILNSINYFPSKEEQQRIGIYFQNLDKLLTLHQKELEKLKHIKKACLEKMFV